MEHPSGRSTGAALPQQRWSWSSLRVRLTLELGAIAVLSLGSVALWSAWQMQQTLAAAHKQTLSYIAQRCAQCRKVTSGGGAIIAQPTPAKIIRRAINGDYKL